MLANFFSNDLELYLYGLDLVVDESTQHLQVVDCNYFSTYNGVFEGENDLCALLDEHLEQVRK